MKVLSMFLLIAVSMSAYSQNMHQQHMQHHRQMHQQHMQQHQQMHQQHMQQQQKTHQQHPSSGVPGIPLDPLQSAMQDHYRAAEAERMRQLQAKNAEGDQQAQ